MSLKFGTLRVLFIVATFLVMLRSRDHRIMTTASMATAAGAAALLYYSMNWKSKSSRNINYDDRNGRDVHNRGALRNGRVLYRLIQAPATWSETISTLLETLRFAYSETLGKWPIGDLAFGVGFLLKRQGTLHVSCVFGGKESLRLKGPEITAELRYLLNFLILCRLFSKKTFALFLEESGYTRENVLLQKPKAGILKPAFMILADHKMKTFLILIRGTHGIKDTLTSATGAVVPFHHTVIHKGGVSNLVLGYAHCGMVAAARWIAKLASPCLVKALDEYPDYKVKIIGHSLGGGTAALLTYVLREREEFSTATCVTFGPAACMTWELAESGIDFITTVINGADLVPSFSAASVDDLRAEVTASAWLNDLRNQIERTRILGTVYQSASTLGSRLSSIVSARARVSGTGAISHPVSSGTQAVMKRAQGIAQAARSFMGGHRRAAAAIREEGSALDSSPTMESSQHFITGSYDTKASDNTIEQLDCSSEAVVQDSEEEDSIPDEMGTHLDTDPNLEEREDIMLRNGLKDHMNEVELWRRLENELYNQIEGEEEEAELGKKIREEEEVEAAAIAEGAESQLQSSVPEMEEGHRFFPPGKIMHIVTLLTDREGCESGGNGQPVEPKVGIFLTPRSLYGKLRLSQSMVSDHLMPVYGRQIELLITELEKEEASENKYDMN